MILIKGGATSCGRRQRRPARCEQPADTATIGEMTAGVAHELNNRLSVILGQAQLLRRNTTIDAVAAQKLEKIEQEVLRASTMTRGLCDRARTEPRRDPVALNTIVMKALQRAQGMLEGRSIALMADFCEPAPVIPGDAEQLAKAVGHIVDNAIEAMGDEGTLTVTTALDDERVELTVTDTGPGMDPDQAARIFEPFYTTKSDVRGAGLGLFLTVTTLKSHGGTITVQSAPGRGTTMRIRLPRAAEAPRLVVVK
jgi:two-component system NtrC family sensor kinase